MVGARLRRPAGDVDPGETKHLRDLTVVQLSSLGCIRLKKARYYQREVDLVGKVIAVKMEQGQIYLDMEISGTRDEALLRALTGRESRLISAHVCPEGCEALVTDEFLVHGSDYEQVDRGAEAWFSNLVKVRIEGGAEADEMANLRREAEERNQAVAKGGEEPPKEAKKEKKKKEKKRARDEEKLAKDKRRRSSSDSRDQVPGQKSLRVVYEQTGLDPDAKVRRKVMKKARKLGKKKKKKRKGDDSSSSSASPSSSSAGSSVSPAEGGLFSSERKMQTIWRHYPGSLTCSAVHEARENLMSSSGLLWDIDRKALPPLMTQYVRQHLAANMSAPMLQEAITVGNCLDYLLQGRVASTCDVLSQRLKSLESLSRGSHWTVARQLELVKSDLVTITGEEEGLQAARRAREEDKLRSAMTRPSGNRSAEAGNAGEGKKGKDWKGTGRGGADEGHKGKGGDGKKDTKGPWQKSKEKEK